MMSAMPELTTGQQPDPLIPYRLRRVKLSVGAAVAILSLSAALLLWLTRDYHDQSHVHSGSFAFPISLAMWLLMAVAMMLPSAWTMISAHLQAGFAAAPAYDGAAKIALLILGYLSIWGLFSLAAAALQVELISFGLIPRDGGWPPLGFSGALFVLAGSFELTSLKDHYLTKCRNPLDPQSNLDRAFGLQSYRTGLEQGLYWLGSCWALMLLMFAAGLMNSGWMAILGALMAAQKHGLLPRFERSLGVVLIITGLAQIGVGVA